ncbi:hypothetical protein MKEN_00303600 [Mycena kentingensis (nom. inval.)]|nr:hypothetical protein MKEN_00303600 [Mycena kentingensis (nom. inval.)]
MAASRQSSTYSEFFSSGLRAGGASRSTNTGPSRARADSPTPANAVKASARYNILRGLARRASSTRSVSVSPRPPSLVPVRLVPVAGPPLHRRRRSSLIELPARLLHLGRRPSSSMSIRSVDAWSLLEAPATASTAAATPATAHSDGTYLIRNHSIAANSNAHVPRPRPRPHTGVDEWEKIDPFGASAASFFSLEVEEQIRTPRAAPTSQIKTRRLSLLSNFRLGSIQRPLGSGIVGSRKSSQEQPAPYASHTRRLSLPLSLPLPVLPFVSAASSPPAASVLSASRASSRISPSPSPSDKYDLAPAPSSLSDKHDRWPPWHSVCPLDEELEEDDEEKYLPAYDPVGAIDWRAFHTELPVLLLCQEPDDADSEIEV